MNTLVSQRQLTSADSHKILLPKKETVKLIENPQMGKTFFGHKIQLHDIDVNDYFLNPKSLTSRSSQQKSEFDEKEEEIRNSYLLNKFQEKQ